MWYDIELESIPRAAVGPGAEGRPPAMRKRLLVCLTAVLCTLGLSGCIFGDVDEMYALPKSSEAYVNLQARINQEKGSAESIAPLSGENRQAIQLVDVDRDGEQEAISFFRDTSSDTPLTIVIFKQDEHGDYQVLAKIQGVGSDIEFISYPNLGGAGGDILVSWQVNAATHTLAAYTITGDQPTEIFKANSGRCLTADLDGDDQEEIILAPATTGETPLRLDYYDNQDGRMELVSTSPLSQGAIEIDTWSSGQLSDGTPALFVTSFYKKDVLITDVFCLSQGHDLKNIALNPETHQSKDVYHYAAGVEPTDINGDGALEVPVSVAVPSFGDSSQATFWWLRWVAYAPDGTRTVTKITYHSGDSWYLEIPSDWTGKFSMRRQESATIGVCTVTFARGVDQETTGDEPATEAEPFLQITCLTGSDRSRQAQQGGRFLLSSTNSTICTGEFLTSSWDCGLDQESLKALFHADQAGWNTDQ